MFHQLCWMAHIFCAVLLFLSQWPRYNKIFWLHLSICSDNMTCRSQSNRRFISCSTDSISISCLIQKFLKGSRTSFSQSHVYVSLVEPWIMMTACHANPTYNIPFLNSSFIIFKPYFLCLKLFFFLTLWWRMIISASLLLVLWKFLRKLTTNNYTF
mgnify:CR=1 FL=1